MQKLADFVVSDEEIITSDKINNFCRMINNKYKVFNLHYVKTDFLKYKNPFSSKIYQQGWRGYNNVIDLNELSVIVTGHSDYDINETYSLINSPQLRVWFCQNMNVIHPKCVAVPIGITNKDEPTVPVCKIIGDTGRIVNARRQKKNIRNLAYLNVNVSTYPHERSKIIDLYKDQKWVTYVNPKQTSALTPKDHEYFLENIRHHKFCFAPRGNGIDTHRLWESLYLGTIPIVKRCTAMSQFEDLPILFVDDWDNITPEWLEEKYDEIMKKEYPLYKLNVSYWNMRIFEAIKN